MMSGVFSKQQRFRMENFFLNTTKLYPYHWILARCLKYIQATFCLHVQGRESAVEFRV